MHLLCFKSNSNSFSMVNEPPTTGSKKISKKVALPHISQFRLGTLSCLGIDRFTVRRYSGWSWKATKQRMCVVLPDALLLVYTECERGHVIDLKRAKQIDTAIRAEQLSSGLMQSTCTLRIRHGGQRLEISGVEGVDRVALWRRAFVRAHYNLHPLVDGSDNLYWATSIHVDPHQSTAWSAMRKRSMLQTFPNLEILSCSSSTQPPILLSASTQRYRCQYKSNLSEAYDIYQDCNPIYGTYQPKSDAFGGSTQRKYGTVRRPDLAHVFFSSPAFGECDPVNYHESSLRRTKNSRMLSELALVHDDNNGEQQDFERAFSPEADGNRRHVEFIVGDSFEEQSCSPDSGIFSPQSLIMNADSPLASPQYGRRSPNDVETVDIAVELNGCGDEFNMTEEATTNGRPDALPTLSFEAVSATGALLATSLNIDSSLLELPSMPLNDGFETSV